MVLKPAIMRSSELPNYDRSASLIEAITTNDKILSTNQRLVLENKKRTLQQSLRRSTEEINQYLKYNPIEINSLIWIPDKDIVWTKAEIIDFNKKSMTIDVKKLDQDSKLTIDLRDLQDIYKVNPPSRTVDDMTSLYYIHEASILYNLYIRSIPEEQKPYTFMANVLIAVNPLRRLVEPKIKDYVNTQVNERSPHPYSIAELAYQQMILRSELSSCQSQSIVISGESGAGKTETSKIVLRYLTSREHLIDNDINDNNINPLELDRRLLDTNPILEAFGNAKTLRNHNSSRFGKFMKLQFDMIHNNNNNNNLFSLVGANIETYLLEKFRLVKQIPGERNFHIFYFLLAGGGSDNINNVNNLLDQLHLTNNPYNYIYLNQSKCIKDDNIDDEILFDELVTSLENVGIKDNVLLSLWKIIASLLHLGNIYINSKDTIEGEVSEIIINETMDDPHNNKGIIYFCELLGLDPSSLINVITKREMSTPRGEFFIIKRTVKEANYVKDAIAKSIYQHLFSYIVKKINKSLNNNNLDDTINLPFIGVLDIFGFEAFEYNDFEQLLINYANEALQATFNRQVFIAETELFEEEGIFIHGNNNKEGKIIWPDNRECIDLISLKPNGVLPLLDQELKTQKPNDEKWNSQLHKTHSTNAHFLSPHEKDKKHLFIIKHFATKVIYTIGNFTDKNNDLIPSDLETFVMSAKLSLMKEIFSTNYITNSNGTNSTNTVASVFCDQMNSLVQLLDNTRCNFIRCIKPNSLMKYNFFDYKYIIDQLRCTGMLATCELLKIGLPTRVTYKEINSIYKPILPPEITPLFSCYNDRTFTEGVLWAFRVDENAYKLGRTKIFFKTGKIALLDALLKVDMTKMGNWIVQRLRKWVARRRWRFAMIKIIACDKFQKLLKILDEKKRAAAKIISFFKMIKTRNIYIKRKNEQRRIIERKIISRKRWKKGIYSIICRNIILHGFKKSRRKIIEHKKVLDIAAIKIQKIVRGRAGRAKGKILKLNKLKKEKERKEREDKEMENERKREMERQKKKMLLVLQEENDKNIKNKDEKLKEEKERLLWLLEGNRNKIIKIQSLYRGFKTREWFKRQLLVFNIKKKKMAALLAAEEAAKLAEEAAMALEFETNILKKVDLLYGNTNHDNDDNNDINSLLTTAYQPQFPVSSSTKSNEKKLYTHKNQNEFNAKQLNINNCQELQNANVVTGELCSVDTVQPKKPFMGETETTDEKLEIQDLSWMESSLNQMEPSIKEIDINSNGLLNSKKETFRGTEEVVFNETINHMNESQLMEADVENQLNPVEQYQEFPTGPPIPYKGGIFTCTMLGHRKQHDQSWGDEYTEYVLRCTWGRGDILKLNKTAWLVGGRYNDFNSLHQELKAAASGQKGKRAPWFPRFPKRHPFSSLIGKNQQEKFISKREKEINRYMTQVLTQMADALLNIHMDRFLNLTLRTKDISEREAYAEARKKWEEEERELYMNSVIAEPLNEEELHEVETLVHQLLEKVICAQAGDIRSDLQLQEMIHAVKVLQPRVAASAQIGANNNKTELIPLAMQLIDDIQDAFAQYNDTLLALRLGTEIN